MRLKEIRTLYGKSGYEIAKVLDISPQYYYELEREEKPIKAEYLFKLADWYNVPVDELRGEVCGLTWNQVDFARGIISVNQQLKRDKDDNLVFDLPKRKRVRDIPMTELARAALLAQQNAQAEAKRFYDKAYQDNDLVCCWDDGRKIDPDYITKRWGKVRKKLGLNPNIRYHDLRHNFATVLLDLGKDPKIVSELLGHADIRTTYNFYIHPKIDSKKKAVEGLDQVLVKQKQPETPEKDSKVISLESRRKKSLANH